MALSYWDPLSRNWWDRFDYPARLLDQHFGMGLLDDDLLFPRLYRGYIVRPRSQANLTASGASDVVSEKDKFQVRLNVKHFKPEEIDVKTVDNAVVIHGKHEETPDEHGFVSREFTRRYMLPTGVEPANVKSSLSPDGVLTIEAPRVALEPPPQNERIVPITMQQPGAGEGDAPVAKQ